MVAGFNLLAQAEANESEKEEDKDVECLVEEEEEEEVHTDDEVVDPMVKRSLDNELEMAADPKTDQAESTPAPDPVENTRGHDDEKVLNMEEIESLVLKLKRALEKMPADNAQKKDLLRRIWNLEEQTSAKEPTGVPPENEDHGTLDEEEKNKGTFQEQTIFGNHRTGLSC